MNGVSLEGEPVLVRGAGQGLGAATSRVLARAGALVAVTDVRAERADVGLSYALHAELRSHGVRVCAVIAGGMRTPFLPECFPDLDSGKLQDPESVAETIKHVLLQPPGTAIAEVRVLPTGETPWP